MNYLNILSFISILSALLINASESGDFTELVEEKARIKADLEEMKAKPTPGQLIFSAPTKPVAPVEAAGNEEPEIRIMATATAAPRASKPKNKKEEKHDESVDEEVKKEEDPKKKEKVDPKKKKPSNSSSSESSDSDDHKKTKKSVEDGSDELPKRLFRPRFRAESSADSIKSSYIMITLAISLLGLLLI